MSRLRPTFANTKDRLTYLLAEYRYILAGALTLAGVVLALTDASIPNAPPWFTDLLAAVLLFGPALFVAGLRFVSWIRTRNRVEVHHINAVTDDVEKYLVAPEVWREKTVEGADPYPVNGGSAWAVREFDWQEGTNTLVVTGVWLSEVEDTKLVTSKQHMESIYSDLVDKYLQLSVLRDSLSEFGAEVQERLVSRSAEASERGTLMDKTAVKDTFGAYEDLAGDADDELAQFEDADLEDPVEDLTPEAEPGGQDVAADGGEPES